MTRLAVLLAVGLFVTGCSRSPERGDDVVRPDESSDPVMFPASERAMNSAIARARAEMGTFISAFTTPKATQSNFAVKKAFPSKRDGVASEEHIWLSGLSYRDGRFDGRVANDPLDVKEVKAGDHATVERSDASDWMFVEDGYLVGGYTLLVLRDQLSDAERKELDDSLPFKIRKP